MDGTVQCVSLISAPVHVMFKDTSLHFINIKYTACFLTQLKVVFLNCLFLTIYSHIGDGGNDVEVGMDDFL